jgi:hypothetical protein
LGEVITFLKDLKMHKLLIVLFSLIISTHTIAEMSGYGTIKTLNQSNYSDVVRVYFSKDVVATDPVCDSSAYYNIKLGNDSRSERLFSMLLAAQMSGKQVNLYLDGCLKQTDSRPSVPQIKGIYLK